MGLLEKLKTFQVTDKNEDGQLDAEEYNKLLNKKEENRSDPSSIYSNNQIVPIMDSTQNNTKTVTKTFSFSVNETDMEKIEERLQKIEKGMNDFLENVYQMAHAPNRQDDVNEENEDEQEE